MKKVNLVSGLIGFGVGSGIAGSGLFAYLKSLFQ
jgi:hypothetical protein